MAQKKKKREGLDFFQKGVFEDGYQIGDVTKAILGTAGDLGVGVVKGVGKMAGGILDAAAYLGAGAADLVGADDFADDLRAKAQENTIDNAFSGLDNYLNQYSVLGKTSDAVAEGLGQVAGIILTGGAGKAAHLGAVGISALTTGTMFTSSYGAGVSEALQGGASEEEANKYGLFKGVVDAGSELIFGGLGKGVKALGISKGLSSLDDVFARKLSDKLSNQVAKNIVQFGVKSSAEGVEEVLAGLGTAAAKRLTYMSDKELMELIEDENLLEQFVVGTVTSGLSQSGIVPAMRNGSLIESNKTGREFISGLTANEKSVLDKVYETRIAEEEKSGKLTNKRKNEIYDEVLDAMEKGELSTDDIEEILGGDSYKAYRDIVDREEKAVAKLADVYKGDEQRLKEEIDALVKTSERGKAKSKLSNEVFDLVKDSRLAESYYEVGRRRESFKADPSKYSEKQRGIVQRAIDSGVLNNTRRTHILVDTLARISEDKDVDFDFATNQKLKESGFAVEGADVNGYVVGNNITLNMDSRKAWQFTVGHEITHVLEGTELYGELQKAMESYARGRKSKSGNFDNEYTERFDKALRLYKTLEEYQGVDGQEKIEKEVIADLVGDYIFNDTDFIRHLSANHRNIFEKIYDEIKYLAKVVTAGSEEARQIEKIKKAFEDAYRAEKNTATDGGAKYSIDRIIGDDGTYYGIGVHLDSTLLEDLTPEQRKAMVVERIIELGGEVVTAYDKGGNAVSIKIAEHSDKFRNKSGKNVRVNKDLTTKFNGNETKQEAVVLVDELIATSRYEGENPARHPHDWLDNNGQNNWDTWITYLQDKNGIIWKATLNITNTAFGEKIIYDIDPIERAGQSGKSDTSLLNQDIPQDSEGVKPFSDIDGDPIDDEGEMLFSLSDDDIAPVGDNATITLPDDFAPVRSDIAPTEAEAPVETEAERYAKDVERINKKFAADKAALDEEFDAKREQLADKDAFISGKAADLYKELRGLKKGVRASEALGYLLDHGYEWDSIRAALVNIRYTPDRLVNQNSTIEDIARKMLDDEYESSQYDLEEEYQERLEALETEAAKKRHEAKRITRKELHAKIIDGFKSAFDAEGYDLDELLKNGKDLSTFSTVDNTPQRVNEKTFGYKAGQILNDLTVNRVAQNETEGIKWLNTITGKKDGLLAQLSKEYGIKAGSKESAAAQMYAEGFYVDDNNDIIEYGDAELAADFPDASVQKRIKGLAADARLRQFYDETLKAINESRTRNGYAEIPRLANYFLHFRAMDDTFSRLGLPFNPNDIRAKDLPTDLNGVTADLKPGKPFFASEKHRMGKRTTFDILGGLERYATSAKNQIYHIDDIQNFRALRNYIADTFGQANGLSNLDAMSEEEAQQRIAEVFSSHLSNYAKFLNEEANILAGKTALIDRGLEGVLGRRAITFLKDLNSLVGRNMVGFNVSSSLTNFIPVAQTFAKTNKADFVKAFSQTVANKLRRGKLDNFAENSPVMIRRKGADVFYRTPVQKVADAGYTLMSAVDDISTELIARTKFNELTRKGMDEQKAHYETDKWVSRLMGDRSIGQMPQLYNSKMLGLITKFQLEVRNQLDSQFYDTIQEAKVSNEDIADAQTRNAKTAAQVASTFVQLAVAQHLFGKAFEAVAGYNPAFDIIEVLMTTFGWDDDEDDEDTALDNIGEGFLALLEDLPYASVVMDGGRIPLSSALPIGQFISGTDKYGNEKSRVETVAEALPYLLPTGGYGQIKKTYQGLSMFDDDLPIAGSYTDSGNLRFPVDETPLNVAQAALFGQWASENAREYFDGEHNTLKENQIQELVDVDIPIREYWDYREGLAEQNTLEEKFDYIAGLDLPVAKKNILINNVVDRDEKVDLSNYDDFANFEEFDFAIKNPTKYAVAKASGGYASYKKHMDELKKIEADKNANGKSISGSRKKKVLSYINSIDADYGEKLIIYKHEYPADDTYNREIIEYLNNRNDISYEEMMVILQELGFIVSADGRVSWD